MLESQCCLCHVDEQMLVLPVFLNAHVFISVEFTSDYSFFSHKHEFEMLKTEY